MRELFMTGSKRDLEESDIYRPIKEDESQKITDHLEKWVLPAMVTNEYTLINAHYNACKNYSFHFCIWNNN